MILPPEAAAVFLALAPSFTAPTFRRFTLLALAALLTTGRRTIADLLRTLGSLASGHRTTFQRVLPSARWSGLAAARRTCQQILRHRPRQQPVILVGDDTVDGHPGRQVYGKARHRDPVRSGHSYTAWRYGHKWVVLAALAPCPGAVRPWALPLLVDLYRGADDNRRQRRPHRTPAQLLIRLLGVLLRWFPDRRFVFVGDAGYGSHEVASFCYARRARLTLVSKFHPQADLFEPPPPYAGKRRPRVKGAALPKPAEVVAQTQRFRHLSVGWYGGGRRRVAACSGTGHWYKSGEGLVPVRWLFVRDQTGTHRDEYFYSTDPSLKPEQLIGLYTGRWNIETTFQELRAHLGLETTRGWCRQTVLRAAPCLFGLSSVVALLYAALPEPKRTGVVSWPGKSAVTFSDALTAVRRWLWAEWVFPQTGSATPLEQLPEPLKDLILNALAPAA